MNPPFWRDTKRERLCGLKCLAALVAVWSVVGSLRAAEIVTVESRDISGAFESAYTVEGRVRYEIFGASVVSKKLQIESAGFEWQGPQRRQMVKALLMWGGSIDKGQADRAKQVVWVAPSGKKTKLKAARYYEEASGSETVYSAVAEITPHLKERGGYRILDMRTRKDRFGGIAVMLFYEDAAAPRRRVRLHMGVARLRPGEMYHTRLSAPEERVFVSRISTIGGGAIAGNGSSNSLNGYSLSGGEDWDGSSGYRWDVDDYPVKRELKGLTWSVDPLLQWVFPMGIVVQTDQKGYKEESKGR